MFSILATCLYWPSSLALCWGSFHTLNNLEITVKNLKGKVQLVSNLKVFERVFSYNKTLLTVKMLTVQE